MAFRKTATPSASKPPTRAQCDAIIRRYLKEDQNIEWKREMPTFYSLWKQYPSFAFWTRHEIPFRLNHMSFFQTVEGAAMLQSDWLVFHYEVPKEAPVPVESISLIDTLSQPIYNPLYTERRPRTVAEFLKTR